MFRVKNSFLGVIVLLPSIYAVSDYFNFLADENIDIYQLHKAPQNPYRSSAGKYSSAGDLQNSCNLMIFCMCILQY